MTRALLAGAVAVAVLVASAPVVSADEDPIEQARRAAETTPFSGRVTVTWNDDGLVRQQHLAVESSGGELLVEGERTMMALDQERLVRRQQGGWDVLWPAGLAPVGHPGVAAQYSVRTSGGPTVAGYPTRAVEVRKNGALRETLFVEASRGLLLRRDQYGETGDLERRVEFETVVIDGPPQAPQAPPRGVRATAVRATSAASLPSWSRAPARLGEGYRRLGVYRQGGVVQALYSDGVYELSLFEQRGRLDRGGRPAHVRAITFNKASGWEFAWPGGRVLMWHAGRSVYTLVGDAPRSDLLAAARGVPAPGGSSLVHKLRQACRGLVEAFSGEL